MDYIFKPNVSWSALNASYFGARLTNGCSLFDSTGPACFPEAEVIHYINGVLNSVVAVEVLKIINPTVRFLPGDIGNIPVAKLDDSDLGRIKIISARAVSISDEDDFESETSSLFSTFPMVIFSESNLLSAWCRWKQVVEDRESELLNVEIENNRILIKAYGLEGELSADVPKDQITLCKVDREEGVQRLISYAIGCMMGRYSLDEPGLIYAHAGNVGFDPTRYKTFPADADGIVPITDELWFEDDAANRVREFLRAVWGADTLDENMAWLAESLGTKAGETPDETIRRYLADKFFKDHLQTYKKRPIYWLFSSGKQGAFQALVYLHRYHEGTLARLRAEYVVPLTGKMQTRIDMLEKDAAAAPSTAARNKLNKQIEKLRKKHVELLAYDEKLRHYADMRINLDLDDGVKVNYGKFGDLLAEVKAVTGGVED